MQLDAQPMSARRRLVILVSLVALLMGLLPMTGVAAPDIAARGTENVCEPPFSSSFDDIAGSAHEANILCMADLGITEGTGDGTSYSPRREVTRAQMASFIVRYIEHYTGESLPLTQGRFDDVALDNVHHDSIHKMLAAGVTEGTAVSDGAAYAPQQPVTRGQMASFLSRAASFIQNGQAVPEHAPPRVTDDHFPDDDGSIHEANINALAAVGIVQGFSDGNYRPGDPVLRDQMASFVMRSYDWAVEVDLGDPPLVPDTDPVTPDPVTPGPVVPGPGPGPTPDPGPETGAVTVQLNWQNVYHVDAWGAVDDFAAYHLENDGAGEVTIKWSTETGDVWTEGDVSVTSQIPAGGLRLHAGALDETGDVAIPLPSPSFVGAAAPSTIDRGVYEYTLDGQVASSSYIATLEDIDAALVASGGGLIDWYVSVNTTQNPSGELRGQLGGVSTDDGGLVEIVTQFEYFEFHELGEGTNTGEDQTSFNLWFDSDIRFAGETGQQRPQPGDFELMRERNGQTAELEIIRVRGDNPDWQPYPKQDIRIHLDTHDIIEDGDVVTVTILDSGAEKLVPVGRPAGADDLSASWRTRCTHVLSVPAMTSEPCGTPPQPGLSGYAATAIDSAPNQSQEFSVTIEAPGIPPRPEGLFEDFDGEPWELYEGEPWELWLDLDEVSHDGLVDYSDSEWTATIGGEKVGTVEFWEYREVERFAIEWEPFLVFTHDEPVPVSGKLVLTGTGIDGSDAAVHGEDTSYDTFVVRYDTGRADYTEIEVNHVPQPTITLEPADASVLAESGAKIELTATYTDVEGVPVADAELRFWAQKGERPNVSLEELGISSTDETGKTTVTYAYDGRDVEVGDPLVDTLHAELVENPFVDAETTVTWATGVATNGRSGATFHDLNDAVVDAEAGDTLNARGAFTSVYGLPRSDRVSVRTAGLTLQAGEEGASLLGAFDVRASGVTVDGFTIEQAGTMEYAFRVEGGNITISDNVIDANGADGFRVRDAWRAVAGRSATISGNVIRGAAIAIDIDNRDQEPDLIVDLTIEGNVFEDNEVGIHYNADGGTTTIANNTFEADVASIVYVRDGTASEALDLDEILEHGGNTFDPAAEILGRTIVPIDPAHEPSLVKVVLHGVGQGNQWTVIEYTRGVACDANGAMVGSQFNLDRGTEQTPNRVGADVECGWDGQSNLVRITWDGNPSFPNAIHYVEHSQPQFHIHNEHELPGGGFTSAESPDEVGPPFIKPDVPEVSGKVVFTVADVIFGGEFAQAEVISDVDLRVDIEENTDDEELQLQLRVSPPGDGDFYGGICDTLFTADACQTIQDAIDANRPFTDDTVFLDGASLEVADDAALGTWQIRWRVDDHATGDVRHFSELFTFTITE